MLWIAPNSIYLHASQSPLKLVESDLKHKIFLIYYWRIRLYIGQRVEFLREKLYIRKYIYIYIYGNAGGIYIFFYSIDCIIVKKILTFS